MTSTKDVTLGVTCYNEQDTIEPTLETLVTALEDCGLSGEIIVMDDASTDSSVTVVREFINRHPDADIAHRLNPSNKGMVWQVFEAAALGEGRYFWAVAGDNTVTPEACRALFSAIGKADIIIPKVLAYRNRSWHRRTISKLYVLAVNILSGYRISYYNGSAIYEREVVAAFKDIIPEFSYSADMIVRLLDSGKNFIEVPVIYNDRPDGRSSALTWAHVIDVLRFFGRLAVRRICRAVADVTARARQTRT